MIVVREGEPKSWYSQAFEKPGPGQAQALPRLCPSLWAYIIPNLSSNDSLLILMNIFQIAVIVNIDLTDTFD